jgi:hypothetical protein
MATIRLRSESNFPAMCCLKVAVWEEEGEQAVQSQDTYPIGDRHL